MRELPKYKKETGEENDESRGQEDDGEKKPLSDEFSEKTNQLLDYIEKTYLQGVIEDDPQGKNIIEKMRLDNTQKVGYIVYQETKRCCIFKNIKQNHFWTDTHPPSCRNYHIFY